MGFWLEPTPKLALSDEYDNLNQPGNVEEIARPSTTKKGRPQWPSNLYRMHKVLRRTKRQSRTPVPLRWEIKDLSPWSIITFKIIQPQRYKIPLKRLNNFRYFFIFHSFFLNHRSQAYVLPSILNVLHMPMDFLRHGLVTLFWKPQEKCWKAS